MINNLDIDNFLQHYWQQKPRLIRNALPNFNNPLSPQELAGLACEQEIESRLITTEQQQWHVQHGPIEESVFHTLPEQNWTLLVQAVDHWVPQVAELLNSFRFIPNWRIDDVMVSYATQGGSVGPHYDNYDVFLLQGAGRRRWQLGPPYSEQSSLQDNQQLRLLKDFVSEQEWELSAGDMLYIPPGYGHWGTSMDNDCMTYSIGFRAPSYGELLSDFCDHQISQLDEHNRYTDPQLTQQPNPGEITAATIDKIQALLKQFIDDKSAIGAWFGDFITAPKYPENTDHADVLDEDISTLLTKHKRLCRDSSARFAYINAGHQATLFVNGCSYNAAPKLAALLANNDHYRAEELQPWLEDLQSVELIKQLVAQGSLYFDAESD